MWRKQSEGKPSSATPNWPNSQSYTPPVSSSPFTTPAPPAQSSFTPAASSSDASVLTHGIRIKGSLTGKGEVVIDGEVVGTIRLGDSRVVIGPNGIIKADIEARDVAVLGTVDGNLRGRERVLLGNTGNVNGNIEAQRVAIEDGARFRGRVEMQHPGEKREERELPKKIVTPVSTLSAAPVRNPAPVPAPTPAAAPVTSPVKQTTPDPVPVEVPGSSH